MNQVIPNKISTIYLLLLVYAFVFLFFTSTASPLYPMQVARDSHIYFIIGKGLFEGLTMYKDLFDHKGPLIFFIYGLASLISKSSFLGVYIMESLSLGVSLIFAFKIASLYLRREYALIAAILLSLFLFSGTIATGGYAEEFIVPFIIGGLYFFLRYFHSDSISHSPRIMLYQGMLVMSVFMIKMSLIVVWIGLLGAILIKLLQHKEYKNILLNLLTFIAGMIIIVVPFAIYFTATNSFDDFIFAYWTFNFRYGSESHLSSHLDKGMNQVILQTAGILVRLYNLLRNNPVQCCMIAIGLLSFCSKRYISDIVGRIGLISSFILLFILTYLQRGYLHYFIPVCVYSILGCIVIVKILKESRTINFSLSFFTMIMVFCISCNFLRCRESFIFLKNEPVFKTHFVPIINKEKNPTLFVMRYPETPIEGLFLYDDAQITPNVKYFIDPIVPLDKYPDIYNTQIDYIKNKKTTFLSISSFSDPYTPPNYVLENYEQVSMLKYMGTDGTTPSYHYLYKVKL